MTFPHGSDEDETARLIILDSPGLSITEFRRQFRQVHPVYDLSDLLYVWRKYQDSPHNVATHDPETGLPRKRG